MLFCLLGLMAYADETRQKEIEKLAGQLKGPNPAIRAFAVGALGLIGTGIVSVVPFLIQSLQDQGENQYIRWNAAIALG